MVSKYEAFDQRLLSWLALNRENVTTAMVNEALSISCTTEQRHVSRRFTQLEDRNVLSCTLLGTTRVCQVISDPPSTLSKQRWRPKGSGTLKPDSSPASSIPAATSQEFEARGGTVQKIPSQWDAIKPSKTLGPMTFFEHISLLD